MSNAKYNNFTTVVGKVVGKGFKDVGSGLGNVTVEAGEGRHFINLWQPRKADKPVVENFINNLEEGTKVEVIGNVEQREWEGELQMNTKAFVSGTKGVTGVKDAMDSDKERAIARLSGDIIEMDMTYTDDIVGKDLDEPIAKLNIKLGIFNTWNPNGDEDLLPAEALINDIRRYVKTMKEESEVTNFDKYKGMIEALKSDQSITNVIKQLKPMLDTSAKMYGVDVLELVAYGEVAEQIGEEVGEGYNVAVGALLQNTVIYDTWGFVEGNQKEIEVKKLGKVNQEPEGADEYDDILGSEDIF